MPALFFAIAYHVGLKLNLTESEENVDDYGKEEDSDDFNDQRHVMENSARIQQELRTKLEQIFSRFTMTETPFGDPKTKWRMIKLIPRSKCYQLRETPYNSIQRSLYKEIKANSKSALLTAQIKSQMTYNLYGRLDLVTLADVAEFALE